MAAFENRPFFGVDRNSTCYQPIYSPYHSLINARYTPELIHNPSDHFHSSSGKNRPRPDCQPCPIADIKQAVLLCKLPDGHFVHLGLSSPLSMNRQMPASIHLLDVQ
jgi:hypothetical protein